MNILRKAQRAFERVERIVRPPLDPLTVNHRDAWRWFDHRRDIVEHLVRAIAPRVPPDGLFIDVGANVGYLSLMVMDSIGFRGEAHLFEPVPHLAALCRHTFSARSYRVTVHELALSDTVSTIPLFVAGDGNIGWNTMTAGKADANMQRIEVPTAPFDCLGLSNPGFIKIDVEGAEHFVLRGMLESLRAARPRPAILCEIGWANTHPEWAEELRAFQALEQVGYAPHDLSGRPLNIADLTETTDVLFLPT